MKKFLLVAFLLIVSQEAFAAGGWEGYLDYTENYASCNGEELYSEEVLNFPEN